MSSKLSERLNAYPAGTWVSAALFTQFMGVALLAGADGVETVTVQARKATDASGAGAVNHGTAVVVTNPQTSPPSSNDIKAAVDFRSDQLGETAGGVPYTHVTLVASDSGDTETATGFLIAGDARFSTDTLGGLGLSGL